MNRAELEAVRQASGSLSWLLGQVEQFLNRTYPRITCRGSQYEEDEILRELLPGEGSYVDFGAGEPIQCSNTWGFYQRGWRGLLVEPLFWYWPALLHERPGDFFYDAAVRNYSGVTLLRIQGSVSSVLPSWNIEERASILVPCETASEILAKFPAVRDNCRLCSIDVEGAERELLESVDWKTFQPEVVVIEYRDYDPQKLGPDNSVAWRPILEAQGYTEVAKTSLNLIWHKQRWPRSSGVT